jgi:hypothetical protein
MITAKTKLPANLIVLDVTKLRSFPGVLRVSAVRFLSSVPPASLALPMASAGSNLRRAAFPGRAATAAWRLRTRN